MIEFANQRVLIFVVAYNAEKTLESLLDPIPAALRKGRELTSQLHGPSHR